MLPSTGDLMVVRLEAGGYWAKATAMRKERDRERKEEYMVVQSCFDHPEGGKRGEEEKRRLVVEQLQWLETAARSSDCWGFSS